MPLSFTCIADLKCEVGESPVYDERTESLHFVDIRGKRLYRMQFPGRELQSWSFESEVGSMGLAASGRLVVALRDRVILFDPQTEARHELCRIEEDQPQTRLNDGKVGPDGAFWVGTMHDHPDKRPLGALYRVEASGQVTKAVDGVITSNGLAWTADGEVMFFADSRGAWIDSWRFDRRTGAMSDRRRFAGPGENGRPDGGACDVEGFYWSCSPSAGRVNRFAPDGSLALSEIAPVPTPTMSCFGARDFRTLFLTSLREGRSAEDLERAPLSGGLFAAEAPVAGFAPWRFLDV